MNPITFFHISHWNTEIETQLMRYFHKWKKMALSLKHPIFSFYYRSYSRQWSVKSRRMSCGKKLLKKIFNCSWNYLVEVGILKIGSNKILHNWHLILTKIFCEISDLTYAAGCYLPKRHLGELGFISCACRALIHNVSQPNISFC